MLSQTGQAAAVVVATPAAVVVDHLPHPVVQHVGDVLLRKRVSEKHYVVRASDTIRHVVRRFAENGTLFALLVVSDGAADRGRVLGLVTARDLLRKLDRNGGNMGEGIGDCMTPSAKVVHVRPDDSVQQAALLMSEMRVSHLPVIRGGEVQGIISIQDISNIALEGARGGKESFVKNVLPRTGISEAARVAAHGAGHSSEWQHSHDPLYLKTGVAALPRAKRDETPIEDANFQTHVAWPGYGAGGSGVGLGAPGQLPGSAPFTHPSQTVSFIGVADGVGSWHGYGVDPRLYAQRLMQRCEEFVWRRALAGEAPPATLDVLAGGWEAVQAEQVVGSCTAAIISVDSVQNQLSVTGVGDCGCILLRDTDLNRVGSLLRGGTVTGIRPGWRVSARATQQLRGFNMPFQLGFAPGHEDKFEKPWQGETLVLPVRDEDIVVAATDGLFDNLDETDILSVVEAWDAGDLARRAANRGVARMSAPPPGPAVAAAAVSPPAVTVAAGDIVPSAGAGGSADAPVLMDGASVGMQRLADSLAQTARTCSLDRMRDGPFARLAKENDILWSSGGRPDDITVVAVRLSTIPPKGPAPPNEQERLRRFAEGLQAESAADAVTT